MKHEREKVKVLITQLCLALCDLTDYSPPGFSVLDSLQAILELIVTPFSRGSSWPRDQTWVSCIAGRFFTIWDIRDAPIWSILFYIIWFFHLVVVVSMLNFTSLEVQNEFTLLLIFKTDKPVAPVCKNISHVSLSFPPPNHCHLTVLAQVLKNPRIFYLTIKKSEIMPFAATWISYFT